MKILLPFLVLLLMFFSHVATCGESSQLEPAIRAANTLIEHGSYKEAEQLLRPLVRDAGIAEDGLDAARVYDLLGLVLFRLGHGEEACNLLERMLSIRVRLCLNDSLELASGRTGYASVLSRIGRNAEAVKQNQEALRPLWKKKDDRNVEVDKVISLIIMNLSDSYTDSGQLWKAEKMFNQALDRATKEGDKSRYKVFIISANLAFLCNKAEKYTEALRLSEEAIAGYAGLYGGEHPELAGFMSSKGIALHKLGRLGEAESTFLKSLKIVEHNFQPGHPHFAMAWSSLAMVYLDQGRYAESDKLLQKALTISLKVFGKEHLATGVTCSWIGDWHRVQNLHADAISYYQPALDIISKKVPNNALTLEDVTSHYALSLRALGRDQEALKLEEEAKKIRERRAAAMQINPQDQDIFLTP